MESFAHPAGSGACPLSSMPGDINGPGRTAWNQNNRRPNLSVVGYMIRIILAVIIVYLVARLGKALLGGKKTDGGTVTSRSRSPVTGEELVKDPYCDTYVPIGDAIADTIGGETVYFCSRECRDAYRANRRESEES